MSLLDRLEFRFGRFAIPGLIRYVVALNAFVYLLVQLTRSTTLLSALVLAPGLIMHGEVWRLVTYIFIPQFGAFIIPGWLVAALYLMFLWWVGNGLEHALGAFRLNLYYFTGMIGITAAAFFQAYLSHEIYGGDFSAVLLNTSLLFAFAQFYPDEVIFVMYIIPAKVKWLAWLSAALLIFHAVGAPLSYDVSLVVALANYFIFFGPEIYRNARLRSQVAERRRKFEASKPPPDTALHECVVCHRTEATHPDLEFRVSRDGQEYCLEHLPPKVPA